MRRGSILSIALILLTILTGCPSAPEALGGGTLSLQLDNAGQMPEGTSLRVRISNGTVLNLSKENDLINLQLPIGTYSVEYEIIGEINGGIAGPTRQTVVIQNAQVVNLRYTYEENRPVEPTTGIVRFYVIDDEGLLSEEQTIAIKLGNNTYNLKSGDTQELPFGTYPISVTEPENLVYELSTNEITLSRDNTEASVAVTVNQATGTLIVTLEGDAPGSGVQIKADDNDIGIVTPSAQLVEELPIGDYILSAEEITGYNLSFREDQPIKISKNGKTEVTLTSKKIEPGKGIIEIIFNTTDVTALPVLTQIDVYLNEGKIITFGTSSSIKTYEADPGTYRLSAVGSGIEGYILTWDESIEVKSGETTTTHIRLSDKGTLHFDVNELAPESPFTLKMMKDGKLIQTISSDALSSADLRLPFGSYTFDIEYEGRNPGVILPEDPVTIVAGETKNVTVDSLYNQNYGYVKAVIEELAGVTDFEVIVGDQILTSANPDCWLPAETYSVVASVAGLPASHEVAAIKDITVVAKKDTTVNIAFKQKPGSGDIEIEDNIAGNLEVTIEGLKAIYSRSEILEATAEITVPEGKTATYKWYIGNDLISDNPSCEYSLNTKAAGKYSVSCFVYIDDAVYSAVSEIRVKD